MKDSDGDNFHVVCAVKRGSEMIVLDSVEKFALPLTEDALSWCCGPQMKVVGITEAYKVVLRQKKRKRKSLQKKKRSLREFKTTTEP